MKPGNSKSFFLLALPLSLYSLSGYAECARNDVDYYLDKGFTPEQITAMCTSAPVKSATTVINETDNSDIQTPATLNAGNTPLNKNEQFLKQAIDGRNVLLANDALQYTLKTCYKHGEEDQYGFADEACPIVKFTIKLEGLEVTQAGKKYLFFGGNEITVKSSIRREIISNLNEYKPRQQKQIQEYLESGDQTIIPIRDDIPLGDVEQVLLQLGH